MNEFKHGDKDDGVDVIGQIATEMGISATDVMQTISEALDHPEGSIMLEMEREVFNAAARKSGLSVLDLLQYLKLVVSKDVDRDADALQADSDRAAADVKVGVWGNDVDFVANVVDEDVGGDEDDWEDEDDRPARGDLPRFLPRPPPSDASGNPFLTVAHTNGFHSLPVVWCACEGHTEDRDLQLLDQHLYPASYDRIKTVFTFSLLDDHRYEYLECKTSHYQYHNKLRRWTCPQCPEAAPNRYKELCRVARQWRNLKYRKWFWLLDNLNAKRGKMALFCAACPQDGVNLEPGWEAEQETNPYGFQNRYRFQNDGHIFQLPIHA